MTLLNLELGERGYCIAVGAGLLSEAEKHFNLKRRVFIITDAGVPKEYALAISEACRESRIYVTPQGEGAKSFSVFEDILKNMLDFNMTRSDAVVAVGGGVVGDLSAFAAASYMRGIDFYNVPTTTLSAIDSSIGGKCGINLEKTKHVVGAFYQPKAVLIDTDTLKTLPKRHYAAGLAEAVKMAATSNRELFELFESEDIDEKNIEDVIVRALKIKKSVVEKDEREAGLRKILNFGHTFGHGVESAANLGDLYHGECVAIGMIPLCSENVRKRLVAVLERIGLPTKFTGDTDEALSHAAHDKKQAGGGIDVIFVEQIGSYKIENMKFEAFSRLIKENLWG